jgi:hypothetical protein
VYGDGGYAVNAHLISPYPELGINGSKQRFNESLSKLRVSVEWTFNYVVSLFGFFDYKRHQKVFLHPIGTYYRVAVVLANCHTCMRQSNEISQKFRLLPPSIHEYLRGN